MLYTFLGNTSTVLIGTLSPLAIHTDESISTMKFADRAMKIQVKAIANEINPDDDKLVQKLRREVIHLKEILQMRKNKTQKDINMELLNLKEENNRLKEMNSATEEVEKLKRENKQLRLVIQENQHLMIESQKPYKTKDETENTDHEITTQHKTIQNSLNSEENYCIKSEKEILDKENNQKNSNK